MRPHVHVITLAVSDLERALAFYREGMGLPSAGIIGTEFEGDDINPAGAVAMFQLDDGLILALYPRTELAKDAGIDVGPARTGEFSIGHGVRSRADVDELLGRAQAAGGTLTGPAHDRPWGIYSGYFRDPDGHLWEIMWNPQLNTDGTRHIDSKANPAQLVEHYIALWNEPDPGARRALIEELWAPDGAQVLVDPPQEVREAAARLKFATPALEVRGYDALEGRVTRAWEMFVEPGEFQFASSGPAAPLLRNVVTFRWEMTSTSTGGVGGAGLEVLALGDDGRIRDDYQFIER